MCSVEMLSSTASSSTATSPANTTTRSAAGSKSSIDAGPSRREQSWRESRSPALLEPQREASMFDLAAIQATLQEFGVDGWLLYEFRGSNVLARRVLDLEAKM